MAHRGNRRTATIIAILVVVALSVSIAFYRMGRSTTAPPKDTPATTSAPSDPTYAPTDQFGSPEPNLQPSEVKAGHGGSTTGPAGLPLGYPQDESGAVSAATNYLIWMNSLKIADKPTADALAGSTAANSETRGALINSFDQLRSGMDDLTADQPEPARGAYALAEYSAEAALVYIWAPEVITDRAGQSSHLWAIDAVPLTWADSDWKLDRTLIAKTGAAAVDPSDAEGNPSAAEKHSILARTPADPGGIDDSADQTWFEYANAPN